jgi:crotonobetainyl-CoA:carnitine CoA-transferase CaiB-like acyl-CoA transferase
MSSLPLFGLKVLDLSLREGGSPCAKILGEWGADWLLLPPGLKLDHPEGRRILLLLVQEADILVAQEGLDVALLHEYNPMLIVAQISELASPWAAASGVLLALRQRERSGLGQEVKLEAGEAPRFTTFDAKPVPARTPEETLLRLGYAPAAIATLRRDGLF